MKAIICLFTVLASATAMAGIDVVGTKGKCAQPAIAIAQDSGDVKHVTSSKEMSEGSDKYLVDIVTSNPEQPSSAVEVVFSNVQNCSGGHLLK